MTIKRNIGIITKPIGNPGIPTLDNMADILESIFNRVFIVTGGEIQEYSRENKTKSCVFNLKYRVLDNILFKIIIHLFFQFQIGYYILKLQRKVRIWIFLLDAHTLIFPILLVKLMRMDMIFILSASIKGSGKVKKEKLRFIPVLVEPFAFFLSDKIIVYSQSLIEKWELEKYKQKISIAHHHFIDTGNYKIIKPYFQREHKYCYIGRLSEEKGIINLLTAVSNLHNKGLEIDLTIIGEGYLKKFIEDLIKNNNLNNHVFLMGWIPHEQLPGSLNEFRILILPSYSEGLPKVIVEAMACGTIVLATSVGSIPDLITDNETGFLMENNSPEIIEEFLFYLFNNQNLEIVSNNAKAWVEKEFSFNVALSQFKKILDLGV